MAAIVQARSRQFDEKVDFNDSLEILKPLVDTLGAQGQRDMMGWTETPFQTLQKKAGSAGTNEAMRDFTLRKVADMNKPRAVTYGNPGTNTMMNPDDWIYARQSMGANLIASMAPGVVSTEMVNPYKQRGMNSLGATATQTQLYVEGANRQLPFSNLDIEQVEFDATNELRRRTKEETSGWALQQFDPTLISMHHKKLASVGLDRLGRRAASQNAFSSTVNNITNNNNKNKTVNIYAPGGTGGYGKGGGGDDPDDGDDNNPSNPGVGKGAMADLFDGDHGPGAAGVGGDGSINTNTHNTDVGGAMVATEGLTEGFAGNGVNTVDPLGRQERPAPPFAIINNTDPGHNTANEAALVPYVIPGDAGPAPTGAIIPRRGHRNLLGRQLPVPYHGSIVIPRPIDVDVPEEYHPTIDAGRARIQSLANHLQGVYVPDGSAGHGQVARDGSVDHSALQTALVATTGTAREYAKTGMKRSRTDNMGMLQAPPFRILPANELPPFRVSGNDDYAMTTYNPPASKRGANGDYNDRDKARRVVEGTSSALILRNPAPVRAGSHLESSDSKRGREIVGTRELVLRNPTPKRSGEWGVREGQATNTRQRTSTETSHAGHSVVAHDDGHGHDVHIRPDVTRIPHTKSSRVTEAAYAAVTKKGKALERLSGDRKSVVDTQHIKENNALMLRKLADYVKRRNDGVI